jgi:hypothetical protein
MRVLNRFAGAAMLLLAACGGTPEVTGDDSAATVAAAATAFVCQPGVPDPRACDPSDSKKTTICHLPPGNPANAHTLCVGTPAVRAHLDHGDRLGSCCDATDVDGGNPGDPPPPPTDPGPIS